MKKFISAFTLFEGASHGAIFDSHRKSVFTLVEGASHGAIFDSHRKSVFTLVEGASHGAMSDSHRKSAFTLAEVLITLGIIGVVAAMTLPVLVAKYQNKQNTVILRKNWSILAQTFLFADNNGAISQIENWSQGDLAAMKSWFDNYINPYLKITSVCYEKWGCWNKNVLYMNGSKFRNDVGCGHNSLSFILNNGSYVCLDDYDKNSVDSIFGVSGVKTPMTMVVYIDVNGDRQPNILGKDVFVGVYSDGKLIPSGNSRTINEINADCSKNGYGYFCTKKFFINNMELPVTSN